MLASLQRGAAEQWRAAFLLKQGYTVYPVNPGQAGKEIHGAKVYARLADVPQPVDMVEVFRASEFVAQVVDEVLALPRGRR